MIVKILTPAGWQLAEQPELFGGGQNVARISSDEYQETQNQLIVIAVTIQGLNLKGFLENISYADTLGPIIDPTLYMKGSSRMHKIEQLARAALEFQRECSQALGLDQDKEDI